MIKTINWEATKEDAEIIHKVALRSIRDYPTQRPLLDIEMDITATHLNGNPLRLGALLNADRFNFAHDIFGIFANLNRRTGEIENCFVPRYSQGGE